MTTMARQLAINSSSATESVGIVSGIDFDEPVRKPLSFQSLTNANGWTDTALSPHLGYVMACNLQELSHSEQQQGLVTKSSCVNILLLSMQT
jgi:hypothetical protein